MNAIPVLEGTVPISLRQASRPPAEAPTPTTRTLALAGPFVLGASVAARGVFGCGVDFGRTVEAPRARLFAMLLVIFQSASTKDAPSVCTTFSDKTRNPHAGALGSIRTCPARMCLAMVAIRSQPAHPRLGGRGFGGTPAEPLMMLTSKILSRKIRTQSTELRNVADAIDHDARLHLAKIIARRRAKQSAAILNAVTAQEDHYTDLLPNPPKEPTAWRGILMRPQRNGMPTQQSHIPPHPYPSE